MAKPTLHLLMGLPGAGKSTVARHIETVTGAERLSSDEVRLQLFQRPCFSQSEHDSLYGILDHNVEHLLETGHDVIYDANLNRHHHRQEKYDLAEKYDADVKLWWVDTPRQLAMQRRLDEQDHVLIPEWETPKRMFKRIASILEPPHDDERHVKIDGSEVTQETIERLL